MRITRAIAAIPVALLMMFGGMMPSHADQAGAKAKSFHACMVTDTGGINDHSFNELTWRGLLAAKAADHKIKANFLPSTSTADYAKNISDLPRGEVRHHRHRRFPDGRRDGDGRQGQPAPAFRDRGLHLLRAVPAQADA